MTGDTKTLGLIYIAKEYIQKKPTLHRMLPSSVDSRGLLGPSPPGSAFLASSVSCFIWQQVSFVSIKFYLQKYEQPCVHIFVQYCSSSAPAFSIWIVTFSSSFLARPACAIFFWCGLPARWDSKVFKKTRSNYGETGKIAIIPFDRKL